MSKKQRIYLPFKRMIGLFGSFIGILLCLPFLWWCIFIINLFATIGHPIFVHKRIGYHKKKSGLFLRITSIDETLQLINIFIGPRSGAAINEEVLLKERKSILLMHMMLN